MGPGESIHNLNEMVTSWTIIHDAHDHGDPEAARAAQAAFFLRYKGPILRYIRAAVHDDAAAEELQARFFERFLSGRFHGADPSRGRFRDYLRRALFNLVADHRRSRRADPGPLVSDVAAPHQPDGELAEEDAEFTRWYRDGLLQRTWQYLEEREQQDRHPYATILRFTLAEPRVKASEIARILSERTGRPLTDVWVRSMRKKARDLFKQYLLQQVCESLCYPTDQLIEEELIHLDLYKFLKDTLIRKRHSA